MKRRYDYDSQSMEDSKTIIMIGLLMCLYSKSYWKSSGHDNFCDLQLQIVRYFVGVVVANLIFNL